MLPTGDIGDRCSEIRQVWRSLVLQTTVDSHAEFVVDSGTAEARLVKFCTHIGYVKYQHKDDKLISLKRSVVRVT